VKAWKISRQIRLWAREALGTDAVLNSHFDEACPCLDAFPGVFMACGLNSAMNQKRKNMSRELQTLQERLRAVLRANMGEARRTRALLRDTERKVEEQLGHLDSFETSWYIAGKKFRKEPTQGIAPRL